MFRMRSNSKFLLALAIGALTLSWLLGGLGVAPASATKPLPPLVTGTGPREAQLDACDAMQSSSIDAQVSGVWSGSARMGFPTSNLSVNLVESESFEAWTELCIEPQFVQVYQLGGGIQNFSFGLALNFSSGTGSASYTESRLVANLVNQTSWLLDLNTNVLSGPSSRTYTPTYTGGPRFFTPTQGPFQSSGTFALIVALAGGVGAAVGVGVWRVGRRPRR
jgi:hypothetical protein